MIRRLKRTILIVDADRADRSTMASLLQGQARDYTIMEADTGEAGLARIRFERPGLRAARLHTLPDMGWREFLDALSWHGRDDVPLPIAVMLTGEQRRTTSRRRRSGRGARGLPGEGSG